MLERIKFYTCRVQNDNILTIITLSLLGKTMPETIFYSTDEDIDVIREWVNDQPNLMWIVCTHISQDSLKFKFEDRVSSLSEGVHTIWIKGEPLTVLVEWIDNKFISKQVSENDHWEIKGFPLSKVYEFQVEPQIKLFCTEVIRLKFHVLGCEHEGSLARSGLNWFGNHYKLIGHPASETANKTWSRLKRFIRKQTVMEHWSGSVNCFYFPDAFEQKESGRHIDINPFDLSKSPNHDKEEHLSWSNKYTS